MTSPSRRFAFALLVIAMLFAAESLGRVINGFDLGGALVPAAEIHSGGPSRDGIPAIDHPEFVSAQRAGFLDDRDQVLGLIHNGEAKAYPFAELSRTGRREIRDRFSGRDLLIRFDWANDSARILDAAGNQLPAVTGFWFAWYAFHPRTEVFTAPRD